MRDPLRSSREDLAVSVKRLDENDLARKRVAAADD
jgi:hypothetical protein